MHQNDPRKHYPEAERPARAEWEALRTTEQAEAVAAEQRRRRRHSYGLRMFGIPIAELTPVRPNTLNGGVSV